MGISVLGTSINHSITSGTIESISLDIPSLCNLLLIQITITTGLPIQSVVFRNQPLTVLAQNTNMQYIYGLFYPASGTGILTVTINSSGTMDIAAIMLSGVAQIGTKTTASSPAPHMVASLLTHYSNVTCLFFGQAGNNDLVFRCDSAVELWNYPLNFAGVFNSSKTCAIVPNVPYNTVVTSSWYYLGGMPGNTSTLIGIEFVPIQSSVTSASFSKSSYYYVSSSSTTRASFSGSSISQETLSSFSQQSYTSLCCSHIPQNSFTGESYG